MICLKSYDLIVLQETRSSGDRVDTAGGDPAAGASNVQKSPVYCVTVNI